MAIVARKNVVYTVPDDAISAYREKGFCVLDETGKIIESASPVTIEEYRALCNRLTEENVALKAALKKEKKTK